MRPTDAELENERDAREIAESHSVQCDSCGGWLLPEDVRTQPTGETLCDACLIPAKPKRKRGGFAIPCPSCGEHALSVRTHDLTIYCEQCSEDTTPERLATVAREIGRLLRWIDQAKEID